MIDPADALPRADEILMDRLRLTPRSPAAARHVRLAPTDEQVDGETVWRRPVE